MKESKEKTYFLKAPYFVLPMPTLHGMMVPRPSESDLETTNDIDFVVARAMCQSSLCLLGHLPSCKVELLSLA